MNEFRNNYLGFNIELENIKYKMFGQEIESEEYKVNDTFDFWQIEKVFKCKEDALNYIGDILNCRTRSECNFYRWCAKDGIREGSLIQFEDKKQGIILGKEYAEGCLKYSPIKKDGTVGSSKRNLYGNIKYQVVKY